MLNSDKQLLIQNGAVIRCKLIVKATSTLPEIVLTEKDSIKDWIYTDDRYVPKQGFIGQFVARTLEGNLQNISEDFNIENREIELMFGVSQIGSQNEESVSWYSFGNFIVTSPENNEVKDNTVFEAMDYTKLFNKHFDYEYTDSTYTQSYKSIIDSGETVTAIWLAKYTCSQVGVDFPQEVFTNSDFVISQNPFQAGESCRDVLKEISKLAYSWVRIGWDNKCYIDFEPQNNNSVDTYNIIDNNKYYTLETKKELYGPINNVVVGMSGIDGESHSIKDSDSITQHGEHTIYIYDNPLINTFELREIAQRAANKLFGLSYTQLDVETIGHPWLQSNDKINALGMGGENNFTYAFNKTITYNGHIRSTISSMGDSEIEETLAYESDIIKNIRNASINVDKQNARIDILVKDNESSKEGFNKRINTLELTSTSTISRIETIEGDIAETNKNLGLLDEDIQGVSADLTDFKDNEYVQGINNLQKQIDGAIQFWNGPDIPTLNNYPASDWKTEVDRTNHQADIYTVIEDVDGEMKQGKSYRFDKVNGTWMWIELTDNELSAVQAIAQEALDKAKTNATDVGNLKTNVSELKQTDEQLTASVESINKQIIPTTGASGSNIYIEDALASPLISLQIEGKSTQEIRDGKNLITSIVAGSTTTSVSNGTITFDFTQDKDTYARVYFPKEVGKTYTFVFDGAGLPDGERVRFYLDDDSSVNYLFKNGKNVWVEYANADTGQFVIDDMSRAEISSIITMSNIMVLEGEYTEDTIPPYQEPGESPSPDYPSEIENVGYENLFDFNKVYDLKNLTNSDGTFTQISADTRENNYWSIRSYNGTTHISKLIQETYNFNGRYMLSFTKTSDFDTIRFGLEALDTLTALFYNVSDFENGRTYTLSFTILNSTQGTISFDDVIITRERKKYNYIPYGKYGIDFTVAGKNIVPFVEQRFVLGGIEFYVDNGSLYLNGTSDSEISSLHSTYKTHLSFELNSGTYVFSHKTGIIAAYLYDENNNNIVLLGSSTKSVTFELSKKTNLHLGFYLYQRSFTNVDTQIMISKNDETYEPYKERVTTIVLNEPPRSLPNGVKDIVYIRNGKLYVDRYVGSLLWDGSPEEDFSEGNTDYSINTVYFGYQNLQNVSIQTNKYNTVHSNLFINRQIWNADQEGLTYEGSASNRTFRFRINKSRLTSLDADGIRAFLRENNVKIEYELAEPYIEEVGEIEIPSTFEGINNITTTDKLEPLINLTYATNTLIANYVEKHIAELKISDDEIRTKVSSVDEFATSLGSSIDSELQEIGKNFNNYVPTSEFVTLEKSVETLQTDTYTKTEINTKLTDGSVTKVSTVSGTFDENGMHYEKTNAPTSSTINEKGVEVDSTTSGEELLFAGYDEELNQTIVRTENLTVRKYFIVGDNSRIENYGNGGGIFII